MRSSDGRSVGGGVTAFASLLLMFVLLNPPLGSNHGIVIYSLVPFFSSPPTDAISMLIAAFWPAPTYSEIPARARSNTSRLTINAYQVWFFSCLDIPVVIIVAVVLSLV